MKDAEWKNCYMDCGPHLNCSLGCSNFLWICAGGQTLSQSPSLASSPDYREEKQKQKKRRRKRRRGGTV